jgi:hypothetical protein
MSDSGTGATGRRATYDEILALPEHVVGEIIDGELIVSPRPAPRHAVAASVLGGELGPPYHSGGNGRPGGWWILFEPELHLGDDVLVPDLAGGGARGCRRFQRRRTAALTRGPGSPRLTEPA